jgi:hypothetical protein
VQAAPVGARQLDQRVEDRVEIVLGGQGRSQVSEGYERRPLRGCAPDRLHRAVAAYPSDDRRGLARCAESHPCSSGMSAGGVVPLRPVEPVGVDGAGVRPPALTAGGRPLRLLPDGLRRCPTAWRVRGSRTRSPQRRGGTVAGRGQWRERDGRTHVGLPGEGSGADRVRGRGDLPRRCAGTTVSCTGPRGGVPDFVTGRGVRWRRRCR